MLMTTGCKSWTRTKVDGKCYLKKGAAPVIKLCSGCDSGVRMDKGKKSKEQRMGLLGLPLDAFVALISSDEAEKSLIHGVLTTSVVMQ